MLVHSEQKEGSHIASVHARRVCGAKAAMKRLDPSQLSALRSPKLCYLFGFESTLGGHAFRNLPLFPIVFLDPLQLVTQAVTPPPPHNHTAATEKPCRCLSSDFFIRTLRGCAYERMTSTLGAFAHLLWRKLGNTLWVCHGRELPGQGAEQSRSCLNPVSELEGVSRPPRQPQLNLWNLKSEDPRSHLGHSWASPGPHQGHTWTTLGPHLDI